MAIMFPDSAPQEATPGEKLMFKTFRDALPDEFLVWHEPSTPKGKPDFILLSPNYGLLVVEVKDWHPEMIIELDQYGVEFQRSGVPIPEKTETPLQQADGYKLCFEG